MNLNNNPFHVKFVAWNFHHLTVKNKDTFNIKPSHGG